MTDTLRRCREFLQSKVAAAGDVIRLVVHRIEAGRLLKTRLAPFAFQKLAVGAVQAAKHLLTGRHIQQTQGIVFRLFIIMQKGGLRQFPSPL